MLALVLRLFQCTKPQKEKENPDKTKMPVVERMSLDDSVVSMMNRSPIESLFTSAHTRPSFTRCVCSGGVWSWLTLGHGWCWGLETGWPSGRYAEPFPITIQCLRSLATVVARLLGGQPWKACCGLHWTELTRLSESPNPQPRCVVGHPLTNDDASPPSLVNAVYGIQMLSSTGL